MPEWPTGGWGPPARTTAPSRAARAIRRSGSQILRECVEGFLDNRRFLAADPFPAEIERKIGVGGGSPAPRARPGAPTSREPGEAFLDQFLAGDFELLHAFAHPLDVAVGMVPELSAQAAQGFDNFASERAGNSFRRRERVAVERSAPGDADPQCKQNEVHVEAVAVLQRDQCVGVSRPLVKGQRETPERLVL